MHVGKGDVRSQRQRRRDRYRGCRVCGIRGEQCTECDLGAQLVAIHGYAALSLIVDGSFVGVNRPRVHSQRYATLKDQIVTDHPDWNEERVEAALIEAITGAPPSDELGHGGAGLVLVLGNEILASRACGFRALSSSDAEFHAVIRAGRWAPGVAIYTDARDLPAKMAKVNPDLAVHYLDPNKRKEAYALAHRLSVEGRCREAPQTIPAVGLDFALERSNLTKTQRKKRGAELLLEHARRDPNFDGDFTALAARLGWTSGRLWQRNPSIRIATDTWQKQQSQIKQGDEDVDGL